MLLVIGAVLTGVILGRRNRTKKDLNVDESDENPLLSAHARDYDEEIPRTTEDATSVISTNI